MRQAFTRGRWGDPPLGPLVTGLAGSVLMVAGGFGSAGVPVPDPAHTHAVLEFWRDHGPGTATALLYGGLGLLAAAWVWLGRDVLANRAGGRGVLATAVVWMLPMLVAAPMYTRDVYYYLAQGALPLAGIDPYAAGPDALSGPLSDNVAPAWLDTPAPYGPLFLLVATGVTAVTGNAVIAGVIVTRLVLLLGLALLVWALPGLTRRLGGRVPVAFWIAVANPVMVVHMVGGIHNDLLAVGLVAAAALLCLRGRHVAGIAVASAAMAVKVTAGFALPFLVLVWAARLNGSPATRTLRAGAAGVAVFTAVFGAISLAAGVRLGWLPALRAPATTIHWYSIPTGTGQLTHAVASLVVPALPVGPFIDATRILGGVALVVLGCRQWWAARGGGPDAVRRAGIVLLAAALLGPTLQSWYPSWGIVLLAAAAWTARDLAVLAFCSLFLMVVTYPDGVTAQHNLVLLAVAGTVWALAALWLRSAVPGHPPDASREAHPEQRSLHVEPRRR